jgi:hypothetical protein
MTMKRTHSNGTPIHPTDGTRPEGLGWMDGMDEIAYFAAHAPNEIPFWFNVERAKRPEEPVPAKEIEGAAMEWKRDAVTDFAEEFNEASCGNDLLPSSIQMPKPRYWIGYRKLAEEYEKAYNEWQKNCREIDQMDSERRYFQWRWYYGEQMAEHRGKK